MVRGIPFCSKNLKGLIHILAMPTLSPTMVRGTLTRIHFKEPGAIVNKYSVFADVLCNKLMKATDPAEEIELEIELQDDLIVAKILKSVGESIGVGEPLAVFCEEPEDIEWASSLDLSLPANLSSAMDSKSITSVVWQAYVKSKKHSISCG